MRILPENRYRIWTSVRARVFTVTVCFFTIGNVGGADRISEEDVRKIRSNRREDPRRHTLSGDHRVGTLHCGVGVGFDVDVGMAGIANINRSTDFEVRARFFTYFLLREKRDQLRPRLTYVAFFRLKKKYIYTNSHVYVFFPRAAASWE